MWWWGGYFFNKHYQYYWVGPFVHMVRLIMLSATLRGCLTKIQWYNGLALSLAITITGRQFQILPSPHNCKPTPLPPPPPFIKEEVISAWVDGWASFNFASVHPNTIHTHKHSVFPSRLCSLTPQLSFTTLQHASLGFLQGPWEQVMEWHRIWTQLLSLVFHLIHTFPSSFLSFLSILKRG